MQLKENTILQSGKYRIIRVLGQGGFGITYLAQNTYLDKLVAIKEFFPKDFCGRDNTSHLTLGTQNNAETVAKLKSRFLKEARNIEKLDHPGIVKIHDIFEENNTAYYVMDYIDGENLNELVKRSGPLSESKAIEYICKVGDALEYIHSRNMTHFDVKPANIVLRKSDDQPILIDFGLSKQYDAHGDATSTLMQGVSNGYSPIEAYNSQSQTSFSPKTDIYSLGATLYYLYTGTIPPNATIVLNNPDELLVGISSANIRYAIESSMCPICSKRIETISLLKDILINTESNYTTNSDNDEATTLLESETININGHEAVDLGLSVLWATSDIGTTDPFKHGDCFLWGDPDGSKTSKVRNSVISRWFSMGPPHNNISGNHKYDTATGLWGSPWRMPTIFEISELYEKCSCIGCNSTHMELQGSTGNSIIIDNRWHWTSESPRSCMTTFFIHVEDDKIYLDFPNPRKSWVDLFFPIRPVADKS